MKSTTISDDMMALVDKLEALKPKPTSDDMIENVINPPLEMDDDYNYHTSEYINHNLEYVEELWAMEQPEISEYYARHSDKDGIALIPCLFSF